MGTLFTLISQIITPLQGLKMSNPDGSVTLHNKGDAFVDDSNLAVLKNDEEHPIDSTIAILQQLGPTWERTLFSTGGAINLSKSFWILMVWKWINGAAKLLTPSS